MIRCASCGHFIAYADIHSGRADQSYVPDSGFSRECLEFVCPACFAEEQALSHGVPVKETGR